MRVCQYIHWLALPLFLFLYHHHHYHTSTSARESEYQWLSVWREHHRRQHHHHQHHLLLTFYFFFSLFCLSGTLTPSVVCTTSLAVVTALWLGFFFIYKFWTKKSWGWWNNIILYACLCIFFTFLVESEYHSIHSCERECK